MQLSSWKLSSSPRLDPREGGHPFGRVSGRMVILLNMQREDSYSVRRVKGGWSLPCHSVGRAKRGYVHFFWRAKGGWSLPWTCRTARSKCLESDMFTRPMLPWTWLTAKFKCNGLSWLPSSSVLGLAWLRDPCYLGLGRWLSPSAMSLIDCQVQVL
jgi:hypothetical protein